MQVAQWWVATYSVVTKPTTCVRGETIRATSMPGETVYTTAVALLRSGGPATRNKGVGRR
jgi:hypothetical protein